MKSEIPFNSDKEQKELTELRITIHASSGVNGYEGEFLGSKFFALTKEEAIKEAKKLIEDHIKNSVFY